MTAAAAIPAVPLACPTCMGVVDVRSPHVAVTGTAVRVYCSRDCLNGVVTDPAPVAIEAPAATSRAPWWIVAGVATAASGLIAAYDAMSDEPSDASAVPAPELAQTIEAKLAVAPALSAIEAARTREHDRALVAELEHDAWIHPLGGPRRRMPVNHNGAFGAERSGERPPECLSGHCGVDLGQTWGEPVHAVHEGVVDFVQRGPNDDRGGMFVCIAHRDGTLLSWYFHLAAIPRWIVPGAKIRVGQVIGVVGDTGVKHSGPHLHFALSIASSKTARARYLDPEPLVAIWPLWIPSDGGGGGRVSTSEAPGLPVRAPSRRKPRKPAPPATASPPVELPVADTGTVPPPSP